MLVCMHVTYVHVVLQLLVVRFTFACEALQEPSTRMPCVVRQCMICNIRIARFSYMAVCCRCL